ncbi:hypothetical protein HPB48_006127 [Haemaphysalis longicornis]|uniref:Paired domain-containing protein n=1 Tax=Haemaphysalis longicornis TaxID=44386 RepID=A0A9J6FWL4_HAELO|nr:hypothetical protein HPB48_006127 [Haemaphysalis longicornis]
MSRVPHSERGRIVELCLKSYTQREIADSTGRPTNTVNRIIQAYRNEGRICDAPQDRRPRVTSAIEDDVLGPRLMLICLALRSSMLNLQVFQLH